MEGKAVKSHPIGMKWVIETDNFSGYELLKNAFAAENCVCEEGTVIRGDHCRQVTHLHCSLL
jgi:hypothetical protein